MKISLLILFLSSAFLHGTSQTTMENYFHNSGVVNLAGFAHPSDTYLRGTHTFYDGFVIIDIFYADNYHTKLRVDLGGLFYFKKIEVLEDNDFISPFSGVELLMNLAIKAAKNQRKEYNQVVGYLANTLGKTVENWDGKDWTLCFLIMDYYSNNLHQAD